MTSKEAHQITIMVFAIIISCIAAAIGLFVAVGLLFGAYGILAVLGFGSFSLLYYIIYSDIKRTRR